MKRTIPPTFFVVAGKVARRQHLLVSVGGEQLGALLHPGLGDDNGTSCSDLSAWTALVRAPISSPVSSSIKSFPREAQITW